MTTDARDWFKSVTGRKVTTVEISGYLGVSRNTATERVRAGLNSDEIITICRALGVSPIDALVDFGKLTIDEVYDFLEGGCTIMETATESELAIELAQRLNRPATVDRAIGTNTSKPDVQFVDPLNGGNDSGTRVQK